MSIAVAESEPDASVKLANRIAGVPTNPLDSTTRPLAKRRWLVKFVASAQQPHGCDTAGRRRYQGPFIPDGGAPTPGEADAANLKGREQ